MISVVFTFVQAIIAAIITAGLYRHRNMWPWIVIYWLVVTVRCILN